MLLLRLEDGRHQLGGYIQRLEVGQQQLGQRMQHLEAGQQQLEDGLQRIRQAEERLQALIGRGPLAHAKKSEGEVCAGGGVLAVVEIALQTGPAGSVGLPCMPGPRWQMSHATARLMRCGHPGRPLPIPQAPATEPAAAPKKRGRKASPPKDKPAGKQA